MKRILKWLLLVPFLSVSPFNFDFDLGDDHLDAEPGRATGKVYKACELAAKLHQSKVPPEQIPIWVCIAKHESRFRTSVMSPLDKPSGTRSHGIFQINGYHWCDKPGRGCDCPCSDLRDSDITDDIACSRLILRRTARKKRSGFMAWSVYGRCHNWILDPEIAACFGQQWRFAEPSTDTDDWLAVLMRRRN